MNTLNQNKSPSDEIDLIELFKVLWNKKWWIALSAFICTSISAIYAFTAKEQWTSKAEIIMPYSSELGSYLPLREEYARIIGEEFDIEAVKKSLYGKFEKLSYSSDVREAFFKDSEVYKLLSEGKDQQGKNKILNELVSEKISIKKPDPKKDPNLIGVRYTFSAETPSLAQNTLKDFVDYVNNEVFQLDLKEFGAISNKKLADLKFEYEKIQKDLNIQKKVELANLSNALDTATKADIKDYSKVLDNNSNIIISNSGKTDNDLLNSKLNNDNKLFLLGEKYLNAQIESRKNNSIVYPTRFYQIEEQLTKLQNLFLNAKNIQVKAYNYLSSPDYPVKKDWPKRILLIIAGIIIGIVLGSLIVLVKKIWDKE